MAILLFRCNHGNLYFVGCMNVLFLNARHVFLRSDKNDKNIVLIVVYQSMKAN